jgi:peroxiredoxin Q/BCP
MPAATTFSAILAERLIKPNYLTGCEWTPTFVDHRAQALILAWTARRWRWLLRRKTSPSKPRFPLSAAREKYMSKPLEPGSKAIAFTLDADGGGKVALKDFSGKPLVLYFYPKDDTTGCTKEALDFTAQAAVFKKLAASVVGVSKDSVAAHDKFKKKHKLNVILASDPEGKVIDAYGSWVEKSLYGRKYMGIDRSTFLIDSKGKIAKIWRKVRVPGHVEEVLDAVRAL